MKVLPYELEINNVVNQFIIFGFGLISADPVQCILSWLCFWATLYNLHAWSNVQCPAGWQGKGNGQRIIATLEHKDY